MHMSSVTMNLCTFREIVDGAAPGIDACGGDLTRLYDYVGLEHGVGYSTQAVSDMLGERIQGSFTSGHAGVWQTCRSLRTDLIREHVLHDVPLDPYFEVLDCLADAIRTTGDGRALVEGDWDQAVRGALDRIRLRGRLGLDRERFHTRDFAVARAARFLRGGGFAIRLEAGSLRIEDAAETALVAKIEDLVATMGGINVARRVFDAISPHYDPDQQRYHVVRRTSMMGGGLPQTPWGYLIQLAAKHVRGRKPYSNTATQWQRLCDLSGAYAAVMDVQPYTPSFYGTVDAIALLPFLQQVAVYDTLFRFPQMRPADVVRIARGMLGWLDTSAPTKAGWSVDQALEIVAYLFDPVRDARGPVFVDEADVRRACPRIPPRTVTQVLDQVLSHPPEGANQRFSRPTDAPIPENPVLKDAGHDFFLRPLLFHSGRRFILLDRSVCAPACLEALLKSLRPEVKGLDEKIGPAIERFLKAEFAAYGIPTGAGEYAVDGEHGECDLVVEVPGTVVFFELKKKPLTRRARAGSDAYLLLDLAGSLLAAQAQAGWHEVRLRRQGLLDLKRNGGTERLELNGREVERVAVSLFDFGSFQDRVLLKQFLEATMGVSFTVVDTSLRGRFEELNGSLGEIGRQIGALHPGQSEFRQPFFHCWFLSVPQLLIFLDDVTDAATFKAALWKCRHLTTDSGDIYYDLSYRKRLDKQSAAQISQVGNAAREVQRPGSATIH